MPNTKFDMSKGFVVEGKDTMEFLQNTLSKMGLTPKDYNEFIVYWLPLMKNNRYNLIHFADTEYTSIAPLKINPEPDLIFRVFMVYKSLDSIITVHHKKLNLLNVGVFQFWNGAEQN